MRLLHLANSLVIVFMTSILCNGQKIDQIEYYFNDDPGLSQGTIVDIDLAADTTFNIDGIDISALPLGIHTLYIRSNDDNGVWSITQSQSFIKEQPLTPIDIQSAEYYFDIDPGIGSATAISISASEDITTSPTINVTGLDDGVHKLHIRSKDEDGRWSFTRSSSVIIIDDVVHNITALEYFIDTDPGQGLATAIPVTPSTDISNLAQIINTSGVDLGLHALFIRAKSSVGVWSLISTRPFVITESGVIKNIVAAEYFIDDDPGINNATPITISTPNTDIFISKSISIAGLSFGIHDLYIRIKDEDNRWSIIKHKPFYIKKDATPVDLVKMEYFFNEDPGLGLGISTSLSDIEDTKSALININTLDNGTNSLYVRSQNENGEWSITSRYPMYIKKDNGPDSIDYAEYFIDEDPGLGLGQSMATTKLNDVPALIGNISILGLDEGIHSLYTRSKADNGKWSITSRYPMYIKDIGPDSIYYAEYFIDEDPGFGLGQNIATTKLNDIPSLIENISILGIDEGMHTFYTRSKADNGKWSITRSQPIMHRDTTTHLITKGEYFINTDPGINQGTAISLPQLTDVIDENVTIIPPEDLGEFDLYVRTMNTANEWSLTHVNLDINKEAALPLDWLSFDVTKEGENAKLNWTVASAFNTSHFEIERKTSNKFDKLGTITSNNVLNSQRYEFIDETVENGWNRYRIKQVDEDGGYTFSDSKSLLFEGKKIALTIYPNPTSKSISINNFDEKIDYTFYIIDNNGRKLISGKLGSDNSEVDLERLNSGAYTILIQKGDSIIWQHTIIKI